MQSSFLLTSSFVSSGSTSAAHLAETPLTSFFSFFLLLTLLVYQEFQVYLNAPIIRLLYLIRIRVMLLRSLAGTPDTFLLIIPKVVFAIPSLNKDDVLGHMGIIQKATSEWEFQVGIKISLKESGSDATASHEHGSIYFSN